MIALFQIEDAIEDGLNILGRIDSRADLKTESQPHEDTEMALLDTHYYGGVKRNINGSHFPWHYMVLL